MRSGCGTVVDRDIYLPMIPQDPGSNTDIDIMENLFIWKS